MKKFILTTNKNTGKTTINPFVYLFCLTLIIIFFVFGKKKASIIESTNNKGGITTSVTDLVSDEGASLNLIKERDYQLDLAKSEASQNDPEFNKNKEKGIIDKFESFRDNEEKFDVQTRSQERLNNLFKEDIIEAPPEINETPLPEKEEVAKSYEGWKPIREILAEQDANGVARSSGSGGIKISLKPTKKQEEQTIIDSTPQRTNQQIQQDVIRNNVFFDNNTDNINFLPIGTMIPAVLMEDVRSNNLNQQISVIVQNDVIFGKRIQLPKGVAKIFGTVAANTTQDAVDITFTTMLFADGTELPISASAYNAFTHNNKNSYQTKGLMGKIIVPPFYEKAKAIYYQALLASGKTFLEDTETVDSDVGVDSATDSSDIANVFQNERLLERALISGTVANLETIQFDLDKYKPYIEIPKGTPLFVRLNATTNIAARTINGVAKAQFNQNLQQNNNPALNNNGIINPGAISSLIGTPNTSIPSNSRSNPTTNTNSDSDISIDEILRQTELIRQANSPR